VDSYDDQKAWPIELDEFVGWMNGEGAGSEEDDDL